METWTLISFTVLILFWQYKCIKDLSMRVLLDHKEKLHFTLDIGHGVKLREIYYFS